jgi:hypothetical protein
LKGASPPSKVESFEFALTDVILFVLCWLDRYVKSLSFGALQAMEGIASYESFEFALTGVISCALLA